MITQSRLLNILLLCVIAFGDGSCEYKQICDIEHRECGKLEVTIVFRAEDQKDPKLGNGVIVKVSMLQYQFEDCNQMKAYLTQGETVTEDILPNTLRTTENGACEFEIMITGEMLSLLNKQNARLYVYGYDYGFTDWKTS